MFFLLTLPQIDIFVMKQFLKYVCATVVGLLITFCIFTVICFAVIAGVAATSDSTDIRDGSVLVVKLNGDIVEHVGGDDVNRMMGVTPSSQGVDDIVTAIDAAAKEPNVKGIYVESGLMLSDYSALREIRNALLRFKTSKKWIVSYGDSYTQGTYYVCSAADKVWMNPEGTLDIHGLAAQPMYVKDLLEKFGVKMTVIKVGTYKSATEQYTESKMSDANREQVTRYVSSLWATVATEIGKSRGISKDSVNAYADNVTMAQPVAQLIKQRLIDKTMYANEVKAEIKKLLKQDADEEIKQITCSELATKVRSDMDSSTDDKIAIYYAEGSIVQNAEAGLLFSGGQSIVSKSMVKDLDELAKDDDVKAVVIRINSGGGDSFASEEIWHSVATLKEKKPVVISMSGAAASGAYYLSAPASWIVAQPTTITGSIGIFGVFPDMTRLYKEKLGLTFDNVKTNKHADMSLLQTARPFDAEEEALLRQYINRGYELFCKRVSDGRKMPIAKVKEIAEGRVWIAGDAMRLKLVDEIGGMPEAIKKAAELAKVKNYITKAYPTPPTLIEQLMEKATGNGNNLDEQMKATLGTLYEPFYIIKSLETQNPIQARCEYININEKTN